MKNTELLHSSTPKKERAPKWCRSFLHALMECGVVSEACRIAKISRDTAYKYRAAHENFATAWDEALEVAADALELEARRRAHEGVEEPVFGRVGKDTDGEVGRIRKYSDTLLIFLLKAARPTKFRERVDMNHSGGVDYKIYEKTHEFDPESA